VIGKGVVIGEGRAAAAIDLAVCDSSRGEKEEKAKKPGFSCSCGRVAVAGEPQVMTSGGAEISLGGQPWRREHAMASIIAAMASKEPPTIPM
jgi:hypothetical protein